MIGINILFANDDVLTQWVMTEVLTQAGFVVESACRGTQVIELLNDGPEFDILITDLDLADTEAGCDIGYHWRRALPGRPVIYTGSSRAALVQPLQFHETFLRTPFNAATLLRTIDSALDDVSFRPVVPALSRRIHHVH